MSAAWAEPPPDPADDDIERPDDADTVLNKLYAEKHTQPPVGDDLDRDEHDDLDRDRDDGEHQVLNDGERARDGDRSACVGRYGLALFPQHAATLAASAIPPEHARARGYVSVDVKRRLAELGVTPAGRSVPGLLVPLLRRDGSTWGHQYRADTPRLNGAGRPVKYETPTGQRNGVDVPPGVGQRLGDPSTPLWVTRGQEGRRGGRGRTVLRRSARRLELARRQHARRQGGRARTGTRSRSTAAASSSRSTPT